MDLPLPVLLLGQLTKLCKLELGQCFRIGDAEFDAILQLTQLTALSIFDVNLSRPVASPGTWGAYNIW